MENDMNILALDCATKCGFATLIDGHIESGVQDFSKRRGESNGMMFLRFRAWLNTFKDFDIKIVVFELAHYRGGAATEICTNLTGRAQEFAAEIGAETLSVHSGTLKKYAVGSGKASKEVIMAQMLKETGRKPIDDNESDAYFLLKFAMQEVGEITQ
jgi:hypothetical protein